MLRPLGNILDTHRPIREDLFSQALGYSPGGPRDEFLRSACGEDAELLEDLRSLLSAHAEADTFLQSVAPRGRPFEDAAGAATVTPDGRESPGQMIDRYKLLELLGEGGFGSVWMAEQKEPVKRRVALKIIKLGMDTRQVVARFEAERQALAVMDHPNIARVLDAGATEMGRPFFVMELVKGEPLTEYCDRHNYSILQRLDLFVQVCKAVQHAHQKGIIHRDLKPGNVLVATQDGAPHAKVIDFGIAKAISRELTEKTLFTEHRQLIGTPEYMSPEQAEGSLDIDTRTDVYSLGVLLYELLTGSTPFDSQSLRAAAYAEIQRIIREVEPPRPSTRLSQSQDTLASVAARRHTEPRRLGSIIRGELDWIVMKCMEKDRQRRYETADSLALDIQRYLAGEAVTAAPPSRLYKVRKVVRKNRGPFAAAAVIALALVLGVVGTSWGMASALRQREIAEQARRDEAQQRLLAQENEHRAIEAATLAEREAQRAEAEAALALEAKASEQARAEELDQVAEFQASQLREIQTALMGTRLRDDIVSRRKAYLESGGRDQEAIAAAMAALQESLTGVNFTNVALQTLDENIFERALAAIEEKFGDQPLVKARLLQTVAETLRTLGLLQRATAPQVEALEIRRRVLGDEHPKSLASIDEMGLLLRAQGKLAEAEQYRREALERLRRILGNEHPDTLGSMNNLGVLLHAQGRYAEAEPLVREALNTSRLVLGNEHPQTLRLINNMGVLLDSFGRFDEAERFFLEALEIRRRASGSELLETLRPLANLGAHLRQQAELMEAEPYRHGATEVRRQIPGDERADSLSPVSNMGFMLQEQGKLAEAEPYYLEALRIRRRVLGDEHPATLTSQNNMAVLLYNQRKFSAAEGYYREALDIRRRVLGDEHPDTLASINGLALLLRITGRLAEAEPYHREALEISRQIFGMDHPATLDAMNNVGLLLFGQRRYAAAEPFWRETMELRSRVLGGQHPETLISINNMGALLVAQRQFAEAEPFFREALAGRRRVLGEEHEASLHSKRRLGKVLIALQKWDEAKALCLECHERNEKRFGPAHKETTNAINLLVELFTAWHAAEPDAGHDASAEQWRSRISQNDSSSPGGNQP